MRNIIVILEFFAGAAGIVAWLLGLVIAKAGWETFFALFPPYAWYLVTQRLYLTYGWLQ